MAVVFDVDECEAPERDSPGHEQHRGAPEGVVDPRVELIE